MAWVRTKSPIDEEPANKFYVRRANGGYSGCINGNPKHKTLNVLNNCVGLANGAFNETYCRNKQLTNPDFPDGQYYELTCNANQFIKKCKNSYSKKSGNREAIKVIEPGDPEYDKAPPVGSLIVWGDSWYYRDNVTLDKCKNCGATGRFVDADRGTGSPPYPDKCPKCGYKPESGKWYDNSKSMKIVNHVAYVYEVITNDKVKIFQSGYGCTSWVWQDLTIERYGRYPIDWYCKDAQYGRCIGYILNPAITPGDNTVTTAPVVHLSSISLSTSSCSLIKGHTTYVSVSCSPSDFDILKADVTWSSSDTSKVTVNSTGTITGVAIGSATVTCTVKYGEKTYTKTCAVTVIADPKVVTGIALSDKSGEPKQKIPLELALTPATGDLVTTVTWESSNTKVASVDSSGVVTALTGGKTKITATTVVDNKTLTATCYITVSPRSGIYIDGKLYSPYVFSKGTWHKTVPYVRKDKKWKKSIEKV